MRFPSVSTNRRQMRFLGLAAVALLCAPAAQAHPHAWIDMKVRLLFDKDGNLAKLTQEWLFDDFYSAYATQGVPKDKAGTHDPAKLDALSHENLKNLAEYDYFTVVKTELGKVPLAGIGDVSTAMVGNRLRMTFTVTLKAPVDGRAGPFVYSIYDPTYFVEMLHAKGGDSIRLENAPKGCRAEMEGANPDPQIALLAAGLDKTQSGGDTLGQHFAEKVVIRCD